MEGGESEKLSNFIASDIGLGDPKNVSRRKP
jgi:hypothetical protein